MTNVAHTPMTPIEPAAPEFPRGLPADHNARIRRMRRLARFLDTAIRVPGTRVRFGADSIIGLIPGAGDLLGGALSAYIIIEAAQLGIPRHLLLRMLANLGIDMAVGAVPLLGDIFDVAFKANRRNLDLVERHFDRLALESSRHP